MVSVDFRSTDFYRTARTTSRISFSDRLLILDGRREFDVPTDFPLDEKSTGIAFAVPPASPVVGNIPSETNQNSPSFPITV